MAELAEVERKFMIAHKLAQDVNNPKKDIDAKNAAILAKEVKRLRLVPQTQPTQGEFVESNDSDIPTLNAQGDLSTENAVMPQQQAKPQNFQEALQSGQFNNPIEETVQTLATGATQGAIGHIAGVLKGLSEQLLSGNYGTQDGAQSVAKSAQEGAASGTYKPQNPVAQNIVQKIGEASEFLTPLTPMAAELGAVAGNAARGSQAVDFEPAQQAATKTANAINESAQAVKNRAKSAVSENGLSPEDAAMALERERRAQELPVPINLTLGDKTRDFKQQRFEKEIAKNPDLGGDIRDLKNENNLKNNRYHSFNINIIIGGINESNNIS